MINTGIADAVGCAAGDAVTSEVGGTTGLGEAVDSTPIGDEAGEDDVLDGTVVDESLVVVAASLRTALLEPA